MEFPTARLLVSLALTVSLSSCGPDAPRDQQVDGRSVTGEPIRAGGMVTGRFFSTRWPAGCKELVQMPIEYGTTAMAKCGDQGYITVNEWKWTSNTPNLQTAASQSKASDERLCASVSEPRPDKLDGRSVLVITSTGCDDEGSNISISAVPQGSRYVVGATASVLHGASLATAEDLLQSVTSSWRWQDGS